MIVFRCNAGPQVGLGHLVRCRALAAALHRLGVPCLMVGPPREYVTADDQALFRDWIAQEAWPSPEADAERLLEIARAHGATAAVLDDYRIDEGYQQVLATEGLRWLQFDAAAGQPLWADLILNANPAVRPGDYADVVRNRNAQLLLGPAYAVLRPEFSPPRQRAPEEPLEQVLVTFGGGDDRGAIELALSSLIPQSPPALRFVVISGAANPRNSRLKRWIELHGDGRVQLLINPPRVANVLASCQLAVMAGGTTTYEAAACGLPMLLITVAQNQVPQARAWEGLGAAIYLGQLSDVDPRRLVESFALMESDVVRFDMLRACRSAVDGRGAQRVARHLAGLL